MLVRATSARSQKRRNGGAASNASIGAYLRMLRPRQWSKNLLVFAGILFAGKLDSATGCARSGAVFLAYCLGSSAAYIVNDVRDVDVDRLHPLKRYRPIAAGRVDMRHALALVPVLAGVSIALAAILGRRSLELLCIFLLVQATYTLWLKRLALVDVAAIAALFVVRAAAGAAAVPVRISPWLLVCTALLALFLGLAKRRAEISLVDAQRTPGRAALGRYDRRLVELLLIVAAGGAAVAYSLYAVVGRDSPAMIATAPLVAIGLGRYLFLVHRRDLGEEPENVLLTDRPLVVTISLWAALSAYILTTA